MWPSVWRRHRAWQFQRLFARTAPDLDLDYSDSALAEGRRHKDAPRRRSHPSLRWVAFTNDRVVRRLRSMWLVSASAAMPRCLQTDAPGAEQHSIYRRWRQHLGAGGAPSLRIAESGSGGWPAPPAAGWADHTAITVWPAAGPAGRSHIRTWPSSATLDCHGFMWRITSAATGSPRLRLTRPTLGPCCSCSIPSS